MAKSRGEILRRNQGQYLIKELNDVILIFLILEPLSPKDTEWYLFWNFLVGISIIYYEERD